ncbi:MAG: sporulation protein YabP [Clostridia bacterium]|nr:sporulation protein YabP [Clostridia bacterium]
MSDISMEKGRNNIIVENRERANISGVCEVISFDEREVSMNTTQGRLTLLGEGLHVEKLNLDIGEIAVTGRIDGFEYTGVQKEGSFWSKIF